MEKLEKLAGVYSAKDFRNEVVLFCLRYAKENKGNNPSWKSYEKMRTVIEKKMFSSIDEILPVISFESKKTKKDEETHLGFVERMKANGYTEKQVKRLVEFYVRSHRS